MKRHRRLLILLLVLAVLPAVPATAQEAPPAEEVQRFIVQVDATAAPEATLPPAEVTDQREAIADAQDDVASSLDDGTVTRDFAAIPYSVVEATPSEIARLQADGLVSTAVPDIELHTTTDASRVMIGAPTVWSANSADGTGQTIAIIDTGVRRTHAFFGSRIVAAANRACFADDTTLGGPGDCPGNVRSVTGHANDAEPCSNTVVCDHGTHVAGIALADDNNGGTDYSGVAPGATLFPIRVFHDVGADQNSAWLSDVLAGLQWAYTKRTAVEPDLTVVNMSLGVGLFNSTCNNYDGGAIRAAIANLTSAGIPVVVSSGNDGSSTQISFPSCVSNVISVGSVFSPKSANEDEITGTSNTNAGLDLLAPGSPITSAVSGGAIDAVGAKSGTSMAAPHVAGSIALLRDARAAELPSHTGAARVSWLQGLLDATGVCITDPLSHRVFRRIQVDDAADFTGAPSALFDDVPSCAWYEDAVNWLIDEGLATGYDDNTFRGDLPITRAAVASMLWYLYGAPNVAHEHTFTDGAAWVEDALDWISDPAGPGAPEPLAAGYEDGTLFRPNNQITRGEVTRMLYRAAGSPPPDIGHSFSDVPAWLDDAVSWAADDPDDGGPLEPIVTGYDDGTFRQSTNITRAAVARMVQRFDAAVQP